MDVINPLKQKDIEVEGIPNPSQSQEHTDLRVLKPPNKALQVLFIPTSQPPSFMDRELECIALPFLELRIRF